LESIHKERLKQLETSNKRENQSRLPKDYSPGDQILITLDADERRSQPKMARPTRGPFTITKVNRNGTVEIDRGATTDTINIRRIKPFYI
jgi:hypothetical protein